jgi:streptogramin lyase
MRSLALRLAAAAVAVVALAAVGSAQAAKVDLTGKWLFSVQTEAGAGSPTVTMKQDGEKLTGHYTGQLGDLDFTTGSVKGNEFTFSFSSDLQGTKVDVSYKGTIVNKDELKGTLSIVGLGEGTFTAKRQ